MAKVAIGKTEGAGPEERPGNAAQENVTIDDTGGGDPGQLKEPDTEKSAAEGTYEAAGRSTEEPLRDTTTDDSGNHGPMDTDDPRDPGEETGQEDIAANTPLRRTQRSRKKAQKTENF